MFEPSYGSRAESSDDYPDVVAVLNDRWRVIACAAGIQWILQCRRSAETCSTARWQGRSFCRTREALIRLCQPQNVGPIDPAAAAILAELPDRFLEKSRERPGVDMGQPISERQLEAAE